MAYVDSIWFHGSNLKEFTMRVNIKLKPKGEVSIDVPIPAIFHETITKLAQSAADHHEQLMRAEILGEEENGQSTST